jgi:aminoglycoside 6'-N-acetyltransferase
MDIKFISLDKKHFPMLQIWLNNSHVNSWYGESKRWSIQNVVNKYDSYCHGYKIESKIHKPINAFIINVNENDIGFIQYYNAYDFSRDGYELINMPKSLAAIDIFIGEENFIGQSIGPAVISKFLEDHVFKKFDYVLVDPNNKNKSAIRCFQKLGFKKINEMKVKSMICMLKSREIINLLEGLEQELLQTATRKSKKKLNLLLADDFKEFSKSGKIYTKQDILGTLPSELSHKFIATNFETIELSPDVVLINYKTTEQSNTALRSSIWKNINNNWQIVFHQGTII